MKVNCVGAGPAGLYLGILLRKAFPTADVTLYERNAPGDTFGFGVVFSHDTLGHLRAADPETYAEIDAGFAHWDFIDTQFKGKRIRSGGHGFCGISRQKLLEILQRRARFLGVKMEFHSDVASLDALRNCDLLVGADGLRSTVRKAYEDFFRPTLEVRKNRYIWLGTQQKFPAFTFSFRENDHGIFQIHAYQFDAESGTCIVECDGGTWTRANLAAASEADSIAYCEKLFAEDLGGHKLIGNRSSWIQFVTVKNAKWHHDNAVLIGDAAHTAHFSIGSGTKLAMEDAIALSASLAENQDISAALKAYEMRRRPLVESTQRAAQRSLEWFEGVKRYWSFPPEQFVFSMLTRSLRVTHANLRVRDPAYIESVDAWHASGAQHRTPAPAMFTPFKLGDLTLENRVVVAPMCQYSATDGTPNDWHLVHLGSRALGGAGLVMAEMTNVSAEGRISPGCTGIYREEHMDAWARIVTFVHERSRAKIGIQLGHAGRKGSTCLPWEGTDAPLKEGNWPLWAPSPLAWSPQNQIPREMTRHDMLEVRQEYVAATKRAARADFDVVELHCAHGYLLSSFLTPLSNQRTDNYGGSLANRARYPLEILDAVREAWPHDRPLSVRISATDWVEGGFSPDDAVMLSILLKEHDVDVIHVSAGGTSPFARPVYGRAFQTHLSDRIRNEVGIPTIAVGNLWSADDVNTILLAGRADLVALARAHLGDPYFTQHAAFEQGFEGTFWPNPYLAARSRPRGK